ncbi:MAG: barstar family protein [Methanobrevibacter sp.]
MELDGKLIERDGHDYLKEALNFPDYYGKNLDALYDCLCEIKMNITLVNSDCVSSDIIDTFVDAASENELLSFKCK